MIIYEPNKNHNLEEHMYHNMQHNIDDHMHHNMQHNMEHFP